MNVANVERKIIFIDLMRYFPVREETILIDSISFTIQHHGIGWDFETAEAIMRNYDGFADGFALGGIFKYLGWQEPTRLHHPGYLRLIRAVTRTPVYVADDLRSFFSEWTLKKILLEQPQIFLNKKVLFQCATVAAIMPEMAQAGAKVQGADPLLIYGLPFLLRGITQISIFFEVLRPIVGLVLFKLVKPMSSKGSKSTTRLLKKWMSQSDILVGFGNILPRLDSFDHLSGKIIFLDSLDADTRQKLEKAGVDQIIEFVPKRTRLDMPSFNQFSVLEAVIDQTRQLQHSKLSLQDYFLKWLERTSLSPQSLRKLKGFRRKCAFIIHPLTQNDLWKVPPVRFLRDSPRIVRNALEKGASYLPCFYMGQLTGVVSEATGQIVDCDFYGMTATPRKILEMNEEFLYKRLGQCVELAKSRGASMVGLGAYTKVAGDAGATVARRASIPVTNGNSYSASTTLWAARQVVEKLGLIPTRKVGHRFKAKAMVIGATGSIGRVSSLLISMVFQEVVLVANRPDKLLELREEILKLSPGIHVTVSTQSHSEISDVDLVITATSNQTATPVVDIDLIKPGAVICDCSRPLDITRDQALRRPDILVIESGEVDLPGNPKLNIDIGLPHPSVYACTAETVLLTLEGRFESFSLSKQLSLSKTKEIYRLGVKHGAKLSAIRGPIGLVTDTQIDRCRSLALERLKTWNLGTPVPHQESGYYEANLFQETQLHLS